MGKKAPVVSIQIKEGKKKQKSKKYARKRGSIILNNICYAMGFEDRERHKCGSSAGCHGSEEGSANVFSLTAGQLFFSSSNPRLCHFN